MRSRRFGVGRLRLERTICAWRTGTDFMSSRKAFICNALVAAQGLRRFGAVIMSDLRRLTFSWMYSSVIRGFMHEWRVTAVATPVSISAGECAKGWTCGRGCIIPESRLFEGAGQRMRLPGGS